MSKLIKNIILDKDRKNYLNLLVDLSILFMKYKNIKDLKFYRTCLMYKKHSGNINDYIPYKKLMNIINNYFKRNEKDPILNNKISFSEYLRKNNIPTTNYLGCIQNKILYDKNNNSLSIKDKLDLLELLKPILLKYSTIFIKQTNSYGGSGIYKVKLTNIIDVLSKIDLDHNYIIEEEICQHEQLSQINPSCINTLRVITYKENDQILIPSCLLRMGVGKSYLDNASSGGIFINYNLDSNKLDKTAHTLFEYGGKSYDYHPDTNFIFEGKNLIYPNEVKDLIIKSARLFQRRVIGWDIAYTKDGPIIIEGNENPHIMMLQITSHGLLSNTIYKRMFSSV